MKMWSALFFGLFLSAGSLSVSSSWAKKELALLQDNTQSPVSKVVKLLEDMLEQLNVDAEEDAKIDESMMCWCKSGEAEKTKAIADNTDKSAQLTNAIQEDRALAARLSTELENLKVERATNNKALETSISIRKKELADFNAAESSTMGTIEQLKGATDALQKGLPKAMMQGEVILGADSPVTHALAHAMKGHKDMLWSMHTDRERELLKKIVMHERDIGFLQDGRVEAITSPLDIIHGTIQQLHETFTKNLHSMQDAENDAQAAHDAAKDEKEAQIDAGTAMINKKTQDLADAEERAAAANVDLDDTQNTLKADTAYLKNLKEQCKLHEEEYAARMKDRQEEIVACNEAHAIVSHDDNRNKFTKTLGYVKRPEGGKLGSRRLKEFKEERETQSMRSQTNAARRQQWGTDNRYMFLQIGSTPQHQKAFGSLLPRAKKLADIAQRTQAFWKAKIYVDNQNASKAAALAKTNTQVHKVDKTSKKKLGLTAQQTAQQTLARGRKDAMKIVKAGVEKMKDELVLQQGEETARKDWCVDEIHAVEKKIDNNGRLVQDLNEHIERIKYMLTEGKEELKHLLHDLEDAQIEVQKGSDDRKKADKQFQKTVMEQKETKSLLDVTLSVLKQFYDRKKKASLLRTASTVDATKLSVVASEVKSVASTMLGGGDSSLNFGNAQNSAMDGVVASGEAGLKARAKELAHAAAQPKPVLVKTKAEVKPAEHKIDPDAVADFMDSWSKIPFRKSASLLQSDKKALKPDGSIAKLLNEAQSTHADAQAIIAQAKAIAGKKAQKAMLQENQPAGAPPPPGFKSKKDSAMSGGIVAMLSNLIDDVDAMIAEAVKDETASQEAYEVYMKESNELLNQLKEHITNLQQEIAKAEQEKELKEQELKDAMDEKARLRQLDIDLWGVEGCKYLLENYDIRKQERAEEIKSLDESITTIGAGGGDPKVAAVMDPKAETVPDVDEGMDLPEMTEPEDEEEEEPEDVQKQPPSEHHVVPEGVEIVGPNGETAISKLAGR
jgi:hypothetical protein